MSYTVRVGYVSVAYFYTSNMASVKYYLNKPKGTYGLKKNPVAINAKVSIDRNNRFELATGERIVPRYWDFEAKRPKASYSGHAELNISLSKIEQDLLQLWRENKHLPLSDLKEKAKTVIQYGTDTAPVQKKRQDLELFIQDFIKKCEEGKISRGSNTVQTYRATLEHLQNFSKYSGRPLSFEAVNLDFYYEFCAWSWDVVDKKIGKKKHSDGTLGKSIKILKMFMHEAYSMNLHANLSYTKKQFKKPEVETDSIYLTQEEILTIYNLDLSDHPHLVESRDLFVFDCWIGLRYSDLTRIKPEHVNGNTIRIRTQKTGEDVVIPFHPIAQAIFSKYNKVLPEAKSNPKYNSDLKSIGALAGLKTKAQSRDTRRGQAVFEWLDKSEMITAHTARRSFATNCYKMGIPTNTIMMVTGHKTEKAFRKYIKLTKDEHAQIMLDHFNKQPLMKIA